MLTGDHESQHEDIDFEGDFQKYARDRYQKELNKRTYAARGIGKRLGP